jgi:RHS repeat-associated protein
MFHAVVRFSVLALIALALPLHPASAASTATPILYPGTEGKPSGFYGSYEQTVAISVPAFRGLEPQLALGYSSSSGNGPVGVGWQLHGFSTIVRVNRGYGAAAFDESDIYLLDGQELVRCTPGMVSPSCATGGTHATRIESYQRIVFDSNHSQWTVWQRNGAQLVYRVLASRGYADGPVIVEGQPQSSFPPFRWGADTATDAHHNTVRYSWQFIDGDSYPLAVDYNGTHVAIYGEPRPDPVTFGVGSVVAKTTRRLKAIDITVGGRRARAYDLSYDLAPGTSRSRLTTLRMYGSDAAVTAGVASGPSFLEWRFTYTQGQASFTVSNYTPWAGYGMNSSNVVTGDFNGDGREDVAHIVTGSSRINFWISNGDGTFRAQAYTSPTGNLNRADFHTGDFDGDGRTDLLMTPPGGTPATIFLSTPPGPEAGPVAFRTVAWQPWAGYNMASVRQRVADFNGDGRDDVLDIFDGTDLVVLWLARGDGTFNPIKMEAGGHVFHVAGAQVGDFNGDGLADLLEAPDGTGVLTVWQTVPDTYPIQIIGPVDVTFGAIPVDHTSKISFRYLTFTPAPGYVFASSRLKLGDFNGDGRTDIIDAQSGTSSVNIWLSRGDGSFETTTFTPWAGYPVRADDIQVGDINGDGRDDLVQFGVNPGTAAIWLAQGLSGAGCYPPDFVGPLPSGAVRCGIFTFAVTLWSPAPGYAMVPQQMRLADLDGDGRADVLHVIDGSSVAATWRAAGGINDLLHTVRNELGATTTVDYVSSACWTRSNRTPRVTTAATVTTDDGRGGTSVERYQYAGALYDWVGRRFLGFHFARRILADGFEETVFHQDYGSVSQPLSIVRRASDRRLLAATYLEYQTNGALVPHTSLESGRWQYDFDGALTGDENPLYPGVVCSQWPCTHARRLYSQFLYDPYGQPTRQIDYGDKDVGGEERTTDRSYASGSPYLVDRVAIERTRSGVACAQCDLLWETDSYYDGAQSTDSHPAVGDLTQVRRWSSSSGAFVEWHATYDGYGNRTAVTDENGASTATAFEAAFNLYPRATTNAILQVTQSEYDPVCGALVRSLDVNGQESRYRYDPLCHLVETRMPGGDFELRTWEALGDPSHEALLVQIPGADGAASHWTRTYFDGLGRGRVTVTMGVGGRDIIQSTDYDGRGRVLRQSAPYYAGDAPLYNAYGFDPIDRPVTTAFPDGTQRSFAYFPGGMRTTDEAGHATTERYDAYGHTVSHDESVGSVSSPVDARGNPQAIVDPAGNRWSFQYDSLGRKVSASDPNAGAWRFEYDNVGNLTAWVDASSRRTELRYDLLGRLRARTSAKGTAAESTITWTFDGGAGAGNKGQLTSATDPSGAIAIDYDAAGRPVHTARRIDGTVYTIDRTYDAAGRLLTSTYPEGQLSYLYDTAGCLRQIPGVVNAATWDAAGHLLVQQNANRTATTRRYDERGRLRSILTTSPVGTIQDLTYALDRDGLIKDITAPRPGETWHYEYDGVHRLLSAQMDGDPKRVERFTYDPTGNITSSFLGAFSYPAAGSARPNAVAAVGSDTYQYDGNGNLSQGGGRTLRYDAENRPVGIDAFGSSWTYGYGFDGMRARRVKDGNVTHFIGDDYEVSGGVAIRTITLAGLPVARRKAGRLSWLHTDHLGAVQVMTDATGNPIERDHAWPYRLAIPGPVASELSGEDDDAGLHYLHARFYDPLIGRFLSPDSEPDPSRVVGMNGYAYGGNDPVNRIDPEGTTDWEGQGVPKGWITGEYGPATPDSPLGQSYLNGAANALGARIDNYVLMGGYGTPYYNQMMSDWQDLTRAARLGGTGVSGSLWGSGDIDQPLMRPTDPGPGSLYTGGGFTSFAPMPNTFTTPGPLAGLVFNHDGSLSFFSILDPPRPQQPPLAAYLPPRRPPPKPAPTAPTAPPRPKPNPVLLSVGPGGRLLGLPLREAAARPLPGNPLRVVTRSTQTSGPGPRLDDSKRSGVQPSLNLQSLLTDDAVAKGYPEVAADVARYGYGSLTWFQREIYDRYNARQGALRHNAAWKAFQRNPFDPAALDELFGPSGLADRFPTRALRDPDTQRAYELELQRMTNRRQQYLDYLLNKYQEVNGKPYALIDPGTGVPDAYISAIKTDLVFATVGVGTDGATTPPPDSAARWLKAADSKLTEFAQYINLYDEMQQRFALECAMYVASAYASIISMAGEFVALGRMLALDAAGASFGTASLEAGGTRLFPAAVTVQQGEGTVLAAEAAETAVENTARLAGYSARPFNTPGVLYRNISNEQLREVMTNGLRPATALGAEAGPGASTVVFQEGSAVGGDGLVAIVPKSSVTSRGGTAVAGQSGVFELGGEIPANEIAIGEVRAGGTVELLWKPAGMELPGFPNTALIRPVAGGSEVQALDLGELVVGREIAGGNDKAFHEIVGHPELGLLKMRQATPEATVMGQGEFNTYRLLRERGLPVAQIHGEGTYAADGTYAAIVDNLDRVAETSMGRNLVDDLSQLSNEQLQGASADLKAAYDLFKAHPEWGGLDRVSFIVTRDGHAYFNDVTFVPGGSTYDQTLQQLRTFYRGMLALQH